MSMAAEIFTEGEHQVRIDYLGRDKCLQQDGITWRYDYDDNDRLVTLERDGSILLEYIYDQEGVDLVIRSPEFSYWFKQGDRTLKYGDYATGKEGERIYDTMGRCIFERFLHGHTIEIKYFPKGKEVTIDGFFVKRIEKQGEDFLVDQTTLFPVLSLLGEVFAEDSHGNILNLLKGEKWIEYEYDQQDQLICEQEEIERIEHSYQEGYHKLTSDNFNSIDVKIDSFTRAVQLIRGEHTLDCIYDPFGRVLSSRMDEGDWSDFIYEGYFEVAKLQEDALIEFRFLDWEGEPVFPHPLYLWASGEEYFVESDIFGNVCALYDILQHQLAEQLEYGAFGEKENRSKNTITPYRYQSQRYYEDIDCTLFGARFYDPKSGRFVSMDPAGFDGTLNRYHFCFNNPLKYADPLGTRAGWNFKRFEKTTIGRFLGFMGTHLLLPLATGEKLRCIGADFAGEERPDFFDKDQVFEVGEYFDEGNVGVIVVNGIRTSKAVAEHVCRDLSQLFQKKICCVHLATEGFGRDVYKASLEWLGYTTPGVDLLEKQLKKYLSAPYEHVVLICHSRGALVTSLATRNLTQEERDRLQIYAFGPARILPCNLASKVVNYVSKYDPVPQIIDFLGITYRTRSGAAKVVYLNVPEGGWYIFDHSFDGRTYREALDALVKEFLAEYSAIDVI